MHNEVEAVNLNANDFQGRQVVRISMVTCRGPRPTWEVHPARAACGLQPLLPLGELAPNAR